MSVPMQVKKLPIAFLQKKSIKGSLNAKISGYSSEKFMNLEKKLKAVVFHFCQLSRSQSKEQTNF